MTLLEQEYTALYKATPPPGDPVPIHCRGNALDDSTHLKSSMASEIWKDLGPSGLQIDEIKHWMAEQTTKPETWNIH
jgi:hypothetical protein